MIFSIYKVFIFITTAIGNNHISMYSICKRSVNQWDQRLYSSIPSCREFALCHLFRGLVPHPDPKEKFQKPTRAWRFLNGKPVTLSLGVPNIPVFCHSHCISVHQLFLITISLHKASFSSLSNVYIGTPITCFVGNSNVLLPFIIWWIIWSDLKIFKGT